MIIRYVIGKPWMASSRRHLVRSEGMPAEHGRNWTVTACGRTLLGWTGPVVPVVTRLTPGTAADIIDCKACRRTAAGRALSAAIAIEQTARKHKWAPHPESIDMLTEEY